MLYIKDLRKNKLEIIKLLKIKNFDAINLIEDLISKDDIRKNFKQSIDKLLSKSNNIAKEIGELYSLGEIDKVNAYKKESKLVKEEVKKLQKEYSVIEKSIYDLLMKIPNIPHASVPSGTSEKDNKILKSSGEEPSLGNDAKPHWKLVDDYKLVDFELGNKITGSGFPVYTGQ